MSIKSMTSNVWGNLRCLFFGPKSIYLDASNNYPGIPPKNMLWEDAWKFYSRSIVPYHGGKLYIEKALESCPTCGKSLVDYRSDFNPELNQHMVTGEYCPDGHYTHIECA